MDICNECGKSVKFGSGKFVNRIPDFNNEAERKVMGKSYPKGDFVCGECDTQRDKEYKVNTSKLVNVVI